MSGANASPTGRSRKLMKFFISLSVLVSLACTSFGQGIPNDSWPTYNGDYSGRRFSSLTKINTSTIGTLGLAWVYRANAGGNLRATIKATPLVVNGVMYFTIPDQVWAIDARSGREIWHYAWASKGGDHIGNRGVG